MEGAWRKWQRSWKRPVTKGEIQTRFDDDFEIGGRGEERTSVSATRRKSIPSLLAL